MMKLLFADDDPHFLKSCLERLLKDEGLEIDTATSPGACLSKISATTYDVVLLDVSFSPNKMEGVELVREIKSVQSSTTIIMLSGIGDNTVIVEAIAAGATDYVIKNQDGDEGLELVYKIKNVLEKKRSAISREAEGQLLASLIGAVFASESMKKVFAKAAAAGSSTKQSVFITGPTGSGKEVIAKAISLGRRDAPYITVNCGAIAEGLVESELFGHVKNAFTGAAAAKKGYFEEAHGGTIFLDEVDSLSLKAQVSILRILQTGELTPVGSAQSKRIKVRVIAATNADIVKAIKDGKFREDLYARLNGISISIPALQDRPEDIPLIMVA